MNILGVILARKGSKGIKNKNRLKLGKENLVEIQSRLKGWQLESFKDSYKHKMENGISLYKKKITNE